MSWFRYDTRIARRFPRVIGGVIHAEGSHNPAADLKLTAAFRAEQAAVLERLGTTPLSELSSLAAWRSVFRGFGVDPTQYRSAAEALLRRLTKQGELPSISTLVDLANLVSIRHALPVAVFDLAAVHDGLVVTVANGDEPWADLGASETVHPEPGEVVFVDAAGQVHARRWCWRQSVASAVSEQTSNILVTVEGHHDDASATVVAALDDLASLLREHGRPTSLRRSVLDAAHPDFDEGASA
jgi:DNA/RNA-binding domain of Phe-tRNA-synthetase-like protein